MGEDFFTNQLQSYNLSRPKLEHYRITTKCETQAKLGFLTEQEVVVIKLGRDFSWCLEGVLSKACRNYV